MTFEELDPHTQCYLQAVSGRQGQIALDHWVRFTCVNVSRQAHVASRGPHPARDRQRGDMETAVKAFIVTETR